MDGERENGFYDGVKERREEEMGMGLLGEA